MHHDTNRAKVSAAAREEIRVEPTVKRLPKSATRACAGPYCIEGAAAAFGCYRSVVHRKGDVRASGKVAHSSVGQSEAGHNQLSRSASCATLCAVGVSGDVE